jgi:hypothetical protein
MTILLIGGTHDGERVTIPDHLREVYMTKKSSRPADPFSLEPLGWVATEEKYQVKIIQDEDRQIHQLGVLAGLGQPIKHLIEGYRHP